MKRRYFTQNGETYFYEVNDEDYYKDMQDELILSKSIVLYITSLIQGIEYGFAMMPEHDKTSILLNTLKEHGFISKDTRLEHFRVIFGIPLHTTQTPFEKIKWKKNKQLLRYFVYTIFPENTVWTKGRYLVPLLFADEHGKSISLPKSDKQQLETSSDFPTLSQLLKNFYE